MKAKLAEYFGRRITRLQLVELYEFSRQESPNFGSEIDKNAYTV